MNSRSSSLIKEGNVLIFEVEISSYDKLNRRMIVRRVDDLEKEISISAFQRTQPWFLQIDNPFFLD